MKPFAAEVVGTALLIILGDGVVAGVVLNKNKAQNSGWIVITTGWAMGVAIAVYAVGRISSAHLNPARTIALPVVSKFSWSDCAQVRRGPVHWRFPGGGHCVVGLSGALVRN